MPTQLVKWGGGGYRGLCYIYDNMERTKPLSHSRNNQIMMNRALNVL